MEATIAQALMYVLPAAIMVAGVKLTLDWVTQKENTDKNFELRAEMMKQHFHIKLAAYERCVLFLERISPQHLLMRLSPVGKTAAQFMDELSLTVQAEYEHNLTQQIYMSPQAWAALVKGKEELLTAFRQAYATLPPNADALQLSNAVVKWMQEQQFFPTQQAIHALKTEAHSYFNT